MRVFYEQAMADPLIGFIFTDVARIDLESHLPKISAFWETILLDAKTYSGGAFEAHADLHAKAALQRAHFERWLRLWFGTVDELFAGPTADAAKVHALRVATAFHARLQMLPAPGVPDPGTGVVPGAAAGVVVGSYGGADKGSAAGEG